MEKTEALQNLLNGTASEEDINLLRQLLTRGEISIGGNVNHSVIIFGSGNTVELPPVALGLLNARSLLGDLERDLTGEEIAWGLKCLEDELPLRAPILLVQFQELSRRLKLSLKTNSKALSDQVRNERTEAMAYLNSLCIEALDISFNALCLGETPPDYDSRSPFRGLESFRPEDSEFFFGREVLTEKLVGRIKSHSFLAVLGASGSGKSSLVMAGLIPVLNLDYAIFRPGINPLAELESVKDKLLIVVDQFEELFTMTQDKAARKVFIAQLLETAKRSKVIITLRSDFLGEVAEYRDLNEEVQAHLENIPPMNMDELRRAMEGQANAVGLRLEADLSQQILDDVEGEPGAMPLLQHALWELWNRRHGHNLRAKEYRAFGRVKQAITSTAEKVYEDCTKPEQDSLRDLFLRLTRLDDSDEGRDTRRRVPIGDLVPSGCDAAFITLLLDKLVKARLIVKTVQENSTEVEVAHDALIRHWERLRAWLNEDRDALRLREGINDDARRWEAAECDESLLNHRGGRLEDALHLVENPAYALSEREHSYLAACVKLRDRQKRERERRVRWTVFASLMAAVVFFMLGGFGLIQRNEATTAQIIAEEQAYFAATAQANAEEQAQLAITAQTNAEGHAALARARELAAQSQALSLDDGTLMIRSGLLAVESAQRGGADLQSYQALRRYLDLAALRVANMGHASPVDWAAFSPDGRYIVSRIRYMLFVWETARGREIASMSHNSWIRSVAFSPNNRYLVSSGDDSTVRIWETETGREVTRISHDAPSSVAFSPDGLYVVSGSLYGMVRVWEAETGREVARMSHNALVISVVYSPDGRYVVSGGCDQYDDVLGCKQSSARVWESETGREIARMSLDGSILAVNFSPDGHHVVLGSDDGTARVWEVASGREVTRLYHVGWVTSVAFSPDGRYVLSSSRDKTARVWEVTTGREVARMSHDDWVTSVAFSPDGRYVLSSSRDKTARVWEATTGWEVARMSHDGWVTSVTFSPDGRYVLSSSSDGTASVWENKTRREVVRISHDRDIQSIALSPDGRHVVSGSDDGTVRVWEAASGREVARMRHDDSVSSVSFSPDGHHVVSRSDDGTVRVWEVESGREVARMRHEGRVLSVTFSPDGKYILSYSSSTVQVWDVKTGSEVARMNHEKVVDSVVFSPDGNYVLSHTGNIVQVWETISGHEVARMHHDGQVNSSTFSPDGRNVVSGSDDKTLRIWEAETGREVARMSHDWDVRLVAFSPDGRYVVSGSNRTVRVWEAASGHEVARMRHDDPVSAFAFSQDGLYVVSGSNDKTARVWEVETGREVTRMDHEGWVLSVAFSPDGHYVLSRSSDGIAKIWQWRLEDLIAEACRRLPRNFTRDEWSLYFPNEPYRDTCPIEPEPTN